METKVLSSGRHNYGQKNSRPKKSECLVQMESGSMGYKQEKKASQTLNTRKTLEMIVTDLPKREEKQSVETRYLFENIY